MPESTTAHITVMIDADAADLRVDDYTENRRGTVFVDIRLGRTTTLVLHNVASVDRLQSLLDEARALLTAAEQKAAA